MHLFLSFLLVFFETVFCITIMKYPLILKIVILLSILGCAEKSKVSIVTNNDGHKLQVNGSDFFITGMNWKYYPIGTNYEYQLWNEDEKFIKEALDIEMTLLQNIGVNSIRHYTDVPPKWISYIYRTYGIYTIINHSFGRYGLEIDGQWVSETDYGDLKTKKILLRQISEMVDRYKGTEGLLMYLLGNENNYGLHWKGPETENIPKEYHSLKQAQKLYQLFNDAAKIIQDKDKDLPVAICNGDTMYLDLIVDECTSVDVLGINAYRGLSFEGMFIEVKSKWQKPVMLTELGADAFHSLDKKEDQLSQARYVYNNWKEVYANAAGLDKASNSIGGFTFQFSDGWWKAGQTINLNVQDSTASWSNGGYVHDYLPGKNNMNEEWFGVCAKGRISASGMYDLYPRKAYFVLKDIHDINPYEDNFSPEKLQEKFSAIASNHLSITSKNRVF